MKKQITLFLLVLLLVSVTFTGIQLPASAAVTREIYPEAQEYMQGLAGKRIGLLSGSILDQISEQNIPDCQIYYYNNNTDVALALEEDKIDAYLSDEPVATFFVNKYTNHEITCELTQDSYAYVLKKDNAQSAALCSQLNEFLAECRESGLMAYTKNKWLGSYEDVKTIDFSGLESGENGVLNFATCTDVGAPFSYIKDGDYAGYDIDMAVMFCKKYGYGLKIQNYSFSSLLNTVQAGMADFAAACITVTDERKESVLFSDANYDGGIVIVEKKASSGGVVPGDSENDDETSNKEGFFESLISSFKKTFIEESRWTLFLEGILNTMIITVASIILGVILGFALFLLCRKGNKFANIVTNICFGIVQRMPIVVLLMILYYAILGKFISNGIIISIVCFTLTFAASFFGIVKNGVDSVGKEQYEAAFALGFSDMRTFFKVILPQASTHFLPLVKSEVVSHIKATAIVGYIAVSDLTRMSDIVRSRTYEAFFPLIATAVIYFLLEELLIFAVRSIEIGTNKKRRTSDKILKGIETK